MLTRDHLAAFVLCLGFAYPALSQSGLGVMRVLPVVHKNLCVDSIVVEPRQNENCLSWTRRETAGPLLDSKRNVLYVGGSDAKLHVVETDLTREIKQVSLPGQLRGRPSLANDHLVFATDNGLLLKLKTDTFEEAWRLQLDAEANSTLLVDGSMLYLVTGASTVYAIDLETQSVRWSKKRPSSNRILIAVQSNPVLFNAKQGKNSQRVLAIGHPSGRMDFLDPQNGDSVFEPLMLGDATTAFPDESADPVVVGDKIAAASFNRAISLIDPTSGSTLWSVQEADITRLLYAEGVLVAAGKKKVLGFDAKTGLRLWRFTFERGAASRMVFRDGQIFVGSDRDGLYVLDLKSGKPLQTLGSSLGFAGDFDFSSNTLFALSTAGYLYAMGSGFKGVVQKGTSVNSY